MFSTLIWAGFGLQVAGLLLIPVLTRHSSVRGAEHWENVLEARKPIVAIVVGLLVLGTMLRAAG